MNKELAILIGRLNDSIISESNVISWGCPIPSFGNISLSRIATIGLNPSNREFVDEKGNELYGNGRRFETLNSLGLRTWSDAKDRDLKLILKSCEEYFHRNPYNGWFKKLDHLISGTSISYYFPSGQACHLDLIPYATSKKWTELSKKQQANLIINTSDTLGLLLTNSRIELLILNGSTVVYNLEKISKVKFEKQYVSDWNLSRKTGKVEGYAFEGFINKVGGLFLNRSIKILGYNHNIQSSFGVTKQVQTSIRDWISKKAKEIL